MDEKILLELKDGIAVIKVNRPEALNALNRQIIDELDSMIEEIQNDKNVKVLIIGGTKDFAAGADITQMVDCTPQQAASFLFSPTFNKVEDLKIPTIAAIDGYALGGGCELALACDLRICTYEAKLGLPETTIGIMPGAGGTVRLARLIGSANAKELILMGTNINGEEALRIGLVNKVVKKDELMDTAIKWAEKIKGNAPIGVQTAKAMIADSQKMDPKLGIELEAERWANLFNTKDQQEGMKAILEKRRPSYTGE